MNDLKYQTDSHALNTLSTRVPARTSLCRFRPSIPDEIIGRPSCPASLLHDTIEQFAFRSSFRKN